ncbi:22317_t:CDS:2, partial [Racocetra persica]
MLSKRDSELVNKLTPVSPALNHSATPPYFLILDWTGIEYGVAKIFNFDCSHRELTDDLKIEGLKNLISVNVGNNKITGLEILNCSKLRRLICSHNELKDLKIENCPNLERIYCSHNDLKKLDLTHLNNLKKLFCKNNPNLKDEDIKILPTTELLDAENFNEEEKKKKGNAQKFLEEKFSDKSTKIIDLSNEEINGSLDLKDYPNLQLFECSNNEIDRLNIENCPKLKEIYAYSNRLKELKINDFTKLEKLNCGFNKLEKLEIENCPELRYLYCNENNLKELK